MAWMCGGRRVLRETFEAGESCGLWIEAGKDVLIIGEDCEGPQTEAAFGERWHRSMLRVDAGQVGAAFGELAPEEYLAESDAPICDLMDLLDERDVPYSYLGLGSTGVVTLRHSTPQSLS